MKIQIDAPGGPGAIGTGMTMIRALKAKDDSFDPPHRHFYKMTSIGLERSSTSVTDHADELVEINAGIVPNDYNVIEVIIHHHPWGG